jgi:hypothetical protein
MRKRCKEGHIGSNNTMPKDKVAWATGEFTEESQGLGIYAQ